MYEGGSVILPMSVVTGEAGPSASSTPWRMLAISGIGEESVATGRLYRSTHGEPSDHDTKNGATPMQLLTIRAAGFTATVDACAKDDGQIWFLSLLGNQQSVRALWARLVKGETAYLSEDELGGGSSCWLAAEAWGTWRFYSARLPSGAAHHGLLVPELAAYACDRRDPSATLRTGFLLLARSEDEAPALHYRFLNRRLDLPLHPSWADWLWERGLTAEEVEALESTGVHAYRCRPDPDALQEDISDAVRRRLLTVPVDEDLAEAA
jgi:hypothetical protein